MYITSRDINRSYCFLRRAMWFFAVRQLLLLLVRCLDYLQLFYNIISTKCHNNNEVLVKMLYIIGIQFPKRAASNSRREKKKLWIFLFIIIEKDKVQERKKAYTCYIIKAPVFNLVFFAIFWLVAVAQSGSDIFRCTL